MTYTHRDFKERMDGLFEKYSSKTAITYLKDDDSMVKYSFSNIKEIIYSVGEMFQNCGIYAGDRVGIVIHHSPYGVIAGMALAYCNITMVPIDATLPTEEINKLLSFSEISGLFTTAKIKEKLDKTLILSVPCFKLDEESAVIKLFDDSVASPKFATNSYVYKDVIAIIFSSGTTGEMKGVMVTYHSTLRMIEVCSVLSGVKDYMTNLCVLPFNHIGGMSNAFTYLFNGCECDFIENINAAKMQKGLQMFSPYFFVMVPKIFEVFEQKINAEIKKKGKLIQLVMGNTLKICGFLRKRFGINLGRIFFKGVTTAAFGKNIYGLGVGASPCKPDTEKFFLNMGLKWANLYASTETNVPITSTDIYDRYPVGNVGNVSKHGGIEVAISAEGVDGIGEILVKTDMIMKGYFKRPDLTSDAFNVNGYFKTGDYGFIDNNGYLHLTGRIKESIVLQNGKKVSPSDVDEYYLSQVAKYDIASRGIAHSEGQYDEIHMFVENNSFSEKEKQKIIADLEKISRSAPAMYRISGVHFVSVIPRTAVGKVKRFNLHIKDDQKTTETGEQITSNNVWDTVCKCIKSLQKLSDDFIITPKMKIQKDIGMDSLGIFEMCVDLNEKYQISIESCLHQEIAVGELVQFIESEDNISNKSDASDYPIKRTEKDYKSYNRFMKWSKRIWKFEILGENNINTNESYIFCPNHESHFDGMWVIGCLDDKFKRSICSIAADYLFAKKIYHKGVVRMGGIPTHRAGNTTTAMKRAYDCLSKEGYSLVIHPEGTRTRDGELGEFKHGAAKLSIESGIKIIPVCINGAFDFFPPQCKIPRIFDWKHFKRYTLQIMYGTPIVPNGKTEKEITDEIRRQIVNMKKQLKGD